MNELSITCFLSLVRTREYLLTAQELSITPQALNRKIQQLEKEIGFSLFLKEGHAVQLTIAGKRFYELFDQFEKNLSAASAALSGNKETVLRICFYKWLGVPDLILERIKQFKTERPGIQIELSQCDHEELYGLIKNEEIDMAIATRFFSRGIEVPFLCNDLYETELNIVMSKQHFQKSQPISPTTLNETAYITTKTFENSVAEIETHVKKECAKIDFVPDIITVQPNIDSVYLDLYMGNGISFLPRTSGFYDIKGLSFIPTPLKASVVSITSHHSGNLPAKQLSDYLTLSMAGKNDA